MGSEARSNPASDEFAGASEVLDIRGRPLKEGDEIIVVLSGPTFVRITKITPNLRPQAPPGLMTVVLGGAYSFAVMRGERNHEFIRVQTAEEVEALLKRPPAPETRPGGFLKLAGERDKES